MLSQGSNYSPLCSTGEEATRAIGARNEQMDAPSVMDADNRWITDGGLLLFAAITGGEQEVSLLLKEQRQQVDQTQDWETP
jgi:hypothetical protein